MVPGPSRSACAITVVILDGDSLSRHAMRMRLAAEDDIELVGEARDASRGIELIRDQRPELVLIDLGLLDLGGNNAIREILDICPESRVIVLAADADETTQLQALRAGAVGFLSKSVELDVLPRVLRGVRAGEAAVSREFAGRLVDEIRAREG